MGRDGVEQELIMSMNSLKFRLPFSFRSKLWVKFSQLGKLKFSLLSRRTTGSSSADISPSWSKSFMSNTSIKLCIANGLFPSAPNSAMNSSRVMNPPPVLLQPLHYLLCVLHAKPQAWHHLLQISLRYLLVTIHRTLWKCYVEHHPKAILFSRNL